MKSFMLFFIFALTFIACNDSSKTNQNLSKIPQPLSLMSNQDDIITIKENINSTENFKNISKNEPLKELIVTTQKSNLIILFLFTTWCEPCKGILPHLENLNMKFKEQISIYGIPVDDFVEKSENFPEALKVFIQENNIHFPIILDSKRSELFKMLKGIEGVPLIVLYDKKGHYIIHYLGAIPEEMIEFDITQKLQQD